MHAGFLAWVSLGLDILRRPVLGYIRLLLVAASFLDQLLLLFIEVQGSHKGFEAEVLLGA